MSNKTALLLFLGMTVVTYIPRMLPVLLLATSSASTVLLPTTLGR